MSQIRRLLVVLAGVLCVSAPLARAQVAIPAPVAAPAGVLQQLPSNTLFAIKVTNLRALSGKVNKLATTMGVAQFIGDFADPLTAIMKQSNISQGINQGGDAVIAFVDPGAAGITAIGDRFGLILLPVSDYTAFIGNFKGATKEDGLDLLTIPGQPAPHFAAHWGDYAALSPNKALIQAQPGGFPVRGLTARQIAGSDVVAFLNVHALSDMAKPFIAQARTALDQQGDALFTQNPTMAKYAPIMKALAKAGLDGADSILSSADGFTIGLNIGAEGVSLTTAVEFLPGSYLGNLAMAIKPASGSVMTGLPKFSYNMYGGYELDPMVMGKFTHDMLDSIIAAANTCGEAGKPIAGFLTAAEASASAGKGAAFGIIMPAMAAPGGGAALPGGDAPTPGVVEAGPGLKGMSVQRGDSAVLSSSISEVLRDEMDVFKTFGLDSMVNMTLTPKARTINGVAFDQFHVSNPNAAGQQAALNGAPGPVLALQQMFGTGQSNTMMGIVDANTMLSFSGFTDQAVGTAIDTIKTGAAPMDQSAPMLKTLGQLPKNPTMVVYIQPSGPDIDPPLGMAFTTDGPAFRMDAYIPAQTAQTLVQDAMMMIQTMSGPPAGQPQPAPGAGNGGL